MRITSIALLMALPCCCVSAAPPQDIELEQAKRAFEKKMKEIDEEAERERLKATDKLRKEFVEAVAKARRRNDQPAVEQLKKEAVALLGEDGTNGVSGFRKLRKGVPLTKLQPLRMQGDVSFRNEWEKIVPAVEGRLTAEPFLWSPGDTASEWPIPSGAKTFETYGHVIRPYGHASSDCVMEVRIDGKPGVKSLPLSNSNRTHKFVVEIPRGAKSITLVTDPNKGEGDPDLAVWVESYFYDR